VSATLSLAVALGLVLANAYFVGAEFAVMAARRSQIEPLAAQSRRARSTLAAMESISAMLACAQLGVTVCSLALGAVAEPALAQVGTALLRQAAVPTTWAHPLAFVAALLTVIYLHVVVGEMVPKNIALAGPDRVALALAPSLLWLSRALSPAISVLNGTANAILRLFGVEPKDEIASAFTAAEVSALVAQSQREGLLTDEHGLISGALEFGGRVAGDVAVPVADLVTIADRATPAEVERLVGRTGFSRFPVVDAEQEITGYLHLKDILYADDDRHDEPIPAKRIRALATVSVADEAEEVLAAMQRSGAHLARVVDPDGVHGVVFLEDVLEELVGEVRDETRKSGPVRAN
jgi:CBS domain containing-hemolysin-like protein